MLLPLFIEKDSDETTERVNKVTTLEDFRTFVIILNPTLSPKMATAFHGCDLDFRCDGFDGELRSLCRQWCGEVTTSVSIRSLVGPMI